MMDKTQKLKAYSDMLFIRYFEEKCAFAYTQGLISGFCHLYSGQEATLVGINHALNKKDHIITSYRCHAHAIISGEKPESVMCELFGRINGSSGGKGGSMHIFSPENNFWGGHGIVGAQTSLGTGIAFAEKYKNTGGICVVFLGDGAANQGQFYESMNLASLFELPVLYVIENNQYSMGTSVARHSSCNGKFFQSGIPFNIEGYEVDGMDVEKVFEKSNKIVNNIRKINRPHILQVNTYRYRGHSMSDPATYRSKQEVKKYKDLDPILKIKDSLFTEGLSQKEIDLMEETAIENIDKIYEFSKKSPIPDISSMQENVYI